jgi:hypothetical protein
MFCLCLQIASLVKFAIGIVHVFFITTLAPEIQHFFFMPCGVSLCGYLFIINLKLPLQECMSMTEFGYQHTRLLAHGLPWSSHVIY